MRVLIYLFSKFFSVSINILKPYEKRHGEKQNDINIVWEPGPRPGPQKQKGEKCVWEESPLLGHWNMHL